jgi:hypothetical protein
VNTKQYTSSYLFKKHTGFGQWRWVHVRYCQICKVEHHVLGNDTRMRPSLPPGAIVCDCGGLIPLG